MPSVSEAHGNRERSTAQPWGGLRPARRVRSFFRKRMLPLKDYIPTRRVPFVNYLLIAANVIVFFGERMLLAQGVDPRDLLGEYALVPAWAITDPWHGLLTAFTAMFMHDPNGWAHIGGNMLFLWIFGDNVEDAIGHAKYLFFYLACGFFAAAAQLFIDPSSTIPMLGASGAIAGVLAAYLRLYPKSPILILNPIFLLWLFFGPFFTLPAWIVIVLFFVQNLFLGFASLGTQQGGVAFFAHVGGFVAGLLLVHAILKSGVRRDYDRWEGWRAPRRRDSHSWG
jgi:membrane associated rhomboid family serine protease